MNTKLPGLCALTLMVGVGCGVATEYSPTVVASGELTLRYDEGMQIYAGRDQLVAEGPVYEGLDDYVRCVPRASMHAQQAQRDGRARRGLAWTGGALGVASLGGVGGLALLDSDRSAAISIIGAGLGAVTVALVLTGVSRIMGNSANGNAVDSLNYYNDTVGSLGGNCGDPPPKTAPGQGRVPVPKGTSGPPPEGPQPKPAPAADRVQEAAVGTVEQIPR